MFEVYDERQILKFYKDILPRLEVNETYFLSLSCRNKYLNEEERRFYHLGSAEMFNRTLVREDSYVSFLKKVQTMIYNLPTFETKSGAIMPEKATLLYVNINPSDMVKAYMSFQEDMNKRVVDLIARTKNNHKADSLQFNKTDILLMNHIQKTRSRKYLIDIDFDVKKEQGIDFVQDFINACKVNSTKYSVIETRNGYHVLINRDTINWNFHGVLKVLEDAYKKEVDPDCEMVINKNDMVPLPGVRNAGFEVQILPL